MNYIAYCRKSTEAEDRQVQSIDSQETELKRLAEREGFVLSKIYRESQSAALSGRPIFNEMLSYIRKHGDSVVVTWKLDRLARNMADAGLIIELMDQGRIKEICTPEKIFRNTGDDKFMMGLNFGIGKKFVDDLSMNVLRGIKTKLERGLWPNAAPIGYLNNKADKTIMLDPVTSPFIKTVFELYASGDYNLRTLTKAMHEKGFRTKRGEKVDKTAVIRILHNSFYYGVMVYQGASHRGTYPPLISQELFEQANDVLSGKHKSKRQSREFVLGGLMTCANCGCGITATIQREKYIYYYCHNGKGGCMERREHLKSQRAEILAASLFTKLETDEELIDIALTAEAEKYKNEIGSKEISRQLLQKRLARIKEQQDMLARRKDTPEDVYTRNMASLRKEQIQLEIQLSKLDSEPEEAQISFEQVKEVFLKANSIAKTFLSQTDEVKREYATTVISNISIKQQNIASYLFKEPFQRIADITDKRDLDQLSVGRSSNKNVV